MKFENKLIVTDLDGTFYDSEHNFHPRNMKAVEYFKENGGLFTVATGRVPSSLADRLDTFKKLTNVPAILCNGAFCYNFVTDERFSQIELNNKKAKELIKFVIDNFSICRIRCSLMGGEVVLNDIKDIDSYEGFTRVSFDDNSFDNLNNIRRAVEESYKDDFSFMFACPEIFEFQAKSATKGQALDRLLKLLVENGKADNSFKVYAVGDFENDIDMLSLSDVPCCPENAIDSVKTISKIKLCSCDEGAIADLIWRIETENI